MADAEDISTSLDGDKPVDELGDGTAPKKQKTTHDDSANDDFNGNDKLAQTRAFGKLILFGEHFVVYKVPALVGAVAAYTDCDMELVEEDGSADASNGKRIQVIDNRPAVPNYKIKKAAEAEQAIELVLKHFKLHDKRVKLTFGGDLCCVSGIGASAAQCVSLARAISKSIPEFTTLTNDEINAAGYEGERGYHGTPSGIDNTAATFGGLLRFQRTDGEPIFIKKKILEPIRIVYASTGITASTTEVVGDVRTKKDADPAWFDVLLQQYLEIVPKAERALEENDMKALGALLNENHRLCQELTVSCKELDDLVDAARQAGAWGAKMSGTGRGGLMVALTPTSKTQDVVATALAKAGAPQVWKTTLS